MYFNIMVDATQGLIRPTLQQFDLSVYLLPPPSWILEITKFYWLTGSRGSRLVSMSNFVKIGQSVAKILRFFRFFKMSLSGTVCMFVCWDYLRPTCVPNLKSLCWPTTKTWKATKNGNMWVVWGLVVTRGHQQHSHSIEHIWLPIRL